MVSMPRAAQTHQLTADKSLARRKRPSPIPEHQVTTPSKRQRIHDPDGHPSPSPSKLRATTTPSKRKTISPSKAPPHNDVIKATTPKKSHQLHQIITPVKYTNPDSAATPGRRAVADRSARKKSVKALLNQVLRGDDDSDDAEIGEEALARDIIESSDSDDAADDEGAQLDAQLQGGGHANDSGAADVAVDETEVDVTPSKKPQGGRPPSSAAASATAKARRSRAKSPTPPPDLPPHEAYFYQNKPGLTKTSGETLGSLELLTHDEYFSLLREYKDPHQQQIDEIHDLLAKSFPQWLVELHAGFNLCLYGYGSKKRLVHSFANHMYQNMPVARRKQHKIVVINGYVKTLTLREILTTILTAIHPSAKPSSSNPTTILTDLLALLTSSSLTITILLLSADAPPLRKPLLQTTLSRLAAHPAIHLCCTVDTPDFALLWDTGLRTNFNFVFHECTTFAAFDNAEMQVVDEVHELLGRKSRRVGGKEGVVFVLRSLPENARSLFRLLVGEVLIAVEVEGTGMDGARDLGQFGIGGGGSDDDDDDDEGEERVGKKIKPGARGKMVAESVGIEYRMLYHKAVEEFICSSEMAFRTLLKEFHDHQIITSRKDLLGTELLSLPFRKEELEAILEELVS